MKNKIETINIQLRTDYAWELVRFLGARDVEDTKEIIDKYKLHIDEYEMEAILRHLFNQLCCELDLET